jgi:hypothetical protein
MAAKNPTEDEPLEFEFDVNGEEWKVRKHRERYLREQGFSEFGAFRLAMRFDIEKEHAVDLLTKSGSEEWVFDQLYD